jgi:hypothetical protein
MKKIVINYGWGNIFTFFTTSKIVFIVSKIVFIISGVSTILFTAFKMFNNQLFLINILFINNESVNTSIKFHFPPLFTTYLTKWFSTTYLIY